MKISTRLATVVGATAIAAGAFTTIAGTADAATSAQAAKLKCHYNVVHLPKNYYLWVFKKANVKSTHVGRLSYKAKRVPGACKVTKGKGGLTFIKVKASNGKQGYAGAPYLKKVK
ncbi:hypothetical protein GCM10023196_007430 [Actinoallomurus vinaceus]|uniref:Uncharacterized protein n=1 Tax=Actinoallomurus vinaceus TaxID=1080074 RepID=A0ABP8U0I4_9ACTN